jgi:hypothetical protein
MQELPKPWQHWRCGIEFVHSSAAVMKTRLAPIQAARRRRGTLADITGWTPCLCDRVRHGLEHRVVAERIRARGGFHPTPAHAAWFRP